MMKQTTIMPSYLELELLLLVFVLDQLKVGLVFRLDLRCGTAGIQACW